jgi:hypothetical protein
VRRLEDSLRPCNQALLIALVPGLFRSTRLTSAPVIARRLDGGAVGSVRDDEIGWIVSARGITRQQSGCASKLIERELLLLFLR